MRSLRDRYQACKLLCSSMMPGDGVWRCITQKYTAKSFQVLELIDPDSEAANVGVNQQDSSTIELVKRAKLLGLICRLRPDQLRVGVAAGVITAAQAEAAIDVALQLLLLDEGLGGGFVTRR